MSLLDWFTGKTASHEDVSFFDEWSAEFLTNAYCQGESDWYREPGMAELNSDFPVFGPLFRNVCARMPERWWFQSVTHASGDVHDATFGCSEGGTFNLCGSPLDGGFRFCLPHTREAHQEQVGAFLRDLQTVLENTDGFSSVRWYSTSMFSDGCAVAADLVKTGAASPFDRPESVPNKSTGKRGNSAR